MIKSNLLAWAVLCGVLLVLATGFSLTPVGP